MSVSNDVFAIDNNLINNTVYMNGLADWQLCEHLVIFVHVTKPMAIIVRHVFEAKIRTMKAENS